MMLVISLKSLPKKYKLDNLMYNEAFVGCIKGKYIDMILEQPERVREKFCVKALRWDGFPVCVLIIPVTASYCT